MTGEASQVVVTAAVEGVIDEAIVSVLLNHAGAHLGPVHGRQGKSAPAETPESLQQRSETLSLACADRSR